MNTNQKMQRYENPFQKLFQTILDERLSPIETGLSHSPISLSEDDKAIYVETALPGLSSNEIDVTLENKVLWIRGEKKEAQDNKKYHYRSQKSFSYQIVLPETVDENKDPETKYENGVLSVTFPKIKGETAKKIQIR